MDLRQLRSFVAIVECGTLTQAARRLHIVQPALSQRLASLETTLGVQLFVRASSGLTPTEAGQVLYEHAQLILKQTELARAAVTRKRGNAVGRVRVGVLRNLAPRIARELFQTIHARLPGVQPDIVVGYTEELVHKLRNAQLDVTLAVEEPEETALQGNYVYSEEVCLVGTERFFHGTSAALTVSDLRELPLVAPPLEGPVHRLLLANAASHGFELQFAGGIEDLTSLQALCKAGVVAACVPECTVHNLNDDGSLVSKPILQADLTRHVFTYTHKDVPRTGAVLAIENILSAITRSQMPHATMRAD